VGGRSERSHYHAAAERRDLFDRRQLDQDKLVDRRLCQVAASGAVIGIVLARERMILLFGLVRIVMVMAAFTVMVVAGMGLGLLGSAVRVEMRMSPGS